MNVNASTSHRSDDPRRDERTIGTCMVFVGLLWGVLVGGLVADDLTSSCLVAAGFVATACAVLLIRAMLLPRAPDAVSTR